MSNSLEAITQEAHTTALNRTKALLKHYHEQPPLYQAIMQIRALTFYTRRKTDFSQCIAKSDLLTTDHKKLNTSALNPILDHLVIAGLLMDDFNCCIELLYPLSAIAADPANPRAGANLAALNHLPFELQEFTFREAHLAIHFNDIAFFIKKTSSTLEDYNELMYALTFILYPPLLAIDWLKTKHPLIQALVCIAKMHALYANFKRPPPDFVPWAHFFISQVQNPDFVATTETIPLLHSRLFQLMHIMGLSDLAKKYTPSLPDNVYYQQENQGSLAFFAGDYEEAIIHYEKAAKLFKTFTHSDSWVIGNTHGALYILLQIQQGQVEKARSLIVKLRKFKIFPLLPDMLEALLFLKQDNRLDAKSNYINATHQLINFPYTMPIVHAITDWVGFLLDPQSSKTPENVTKFKAKLADYQTLQHRIAAQIYAELLLAIKPNHEAALAFFNANPPFGAFRFVSLFPIKEAWEFAIDQLQRLFIGSDTSSPQTNSSAQGKRLAWFVNPDNLAIDINEQKIQKNGSWSQGRAIALKRLYITLDPKLDYFTDQDKITALQGLKREVYGWYNQENFYWSASETLKALIGHPLVFDMRNPAIPIELVAEELELQVETKKDGYHLSMAHHRDTPGIVLEQETANRYRVIDFTEEAVKISQIVSKKGLTVPAGAKNALTKIVSQAKLNIRIHSELEDDTMPTLAGSTTCCVQLLPLGNGLKINVWMKPFEVDGPYCRPGHGQATIITFCTINDQRIRQKAIRNFKAERASAEALIAQCPTLLAFNQQTDEWLIESVEECLEVLLELENYKKNNTQNAPLTIEWPKGQTLKVKKSIDASNLSLSIKGKEYWFEYEGNITLDDNKTLDMKNILDLLDQDHGRFIQLADGEFIALTASFKKQLEDLKAISEGNKIYHLSTGVLQALSDETAHLKANKQWKTHLEKLQSMEKHCPAVPSTLQATLREYQETGFAYLSRLIHWNIGACLADDMGLGKTVQAIALLLEQAPQGPCLVVAPTSVCFIWQEELAKFAPTLNAHTLYNSNDRKTLIESLQAMDILICSYGLLQQAGEILCDKDWQLIILDEAQAIKNSETKRWQHATQLKGKGRVALTGTPIENHLGEIWSLFRFLNPGLLGSRETFQKRYAIPIEKNRDPIAKRTLKNLVQPYILRRTKAEVLQELPSKTEQSILIEPTADEIAFYQAVRIKALERIEQLNESQEGSKRFGILAEITRLRQACCHTSLVDPNINLDSSKINTFLTLVKNLLDNKHKVLVFSQYVRYLSLIKGVLDNEAISYQYLDGSTKMQDRQKSVNDFQAGLGDVFLISLKAGGTGLNLTAADYVIILDPWWNPAVEDQAADRAHRLGQQRPVTVYRLIMKNSIEEKIIKLHHDKRDLASDLLSGGDMSGKISEDELIRLIAE